MREDTLEKIEILILADADSANNIVSVLESSPLQFNWQQTVKITEGFNTAAIDVVLYDANLEEINLERAIASTSRPVIAIDSKAKISTAVAAIKAGAVDYLASESWSDLPQAIVKALSESDSQSQTQTQANLQLQKLIIENPDGIIVVDERGRVQFVNPAALELLGKSSSELVGEALGFPVVNGDYLEVDLPISKNKILVAQMRVSQIQWQGTNAYVVSLRDITQLKQAEEDKERLLESAQAANRAKDEFLAVLSHELRTPLNPIVGWSQLLAKGGLPEAQVRQGAEIIQRNAMLQTKLIEDVLDISRIIQGKLKLQICTVNLADTINNAVETVSLAAQAKAIDIQTSLAADAIVKGDPTRLQQIVWNLLSNAIKFTPNEGIVKVRLSLQQDELGSSAQIRVIDSGKGIAPEFLPHVFDYFRQAESTKSRSEGGLGLGLAIVRRLIEMHGGHVTASSEGIGKGAIFTISLPILADSTKTSSEKTPLQNDSLANRKILVVDDDDDSRNLICFVLETAGAEVTAVRSAAEALSSIEQFQPNLLISDIGMPQMNGYELIQKIRQLQPNTGIKAIALSGYASEADRKQSLSAGFDEHLNKPIDLKSLMKAIAD